MAYRELIKNFARIRSYMREFYVYGFKSREEYTEKSVRSYDNERRRVESWLGEHMSFHQDAGGKNVFLSMDSRRIPHNPLYKAFKAKSFTDKDITLHFYILDLLADGSALSAGEMTDRICTVYLSRFTDALTLDESTVRKKLKEYESLGLLRAEKSGREVLYRRTDSEHPALDSWEDALTFFSEEDPLGVIGSFLMDTLGRSFDGFRFKHHYILHALDSDILCKLLLAIDRQAEKLDLVQDILLELNLAGEVSKSGLSVPQALPAARLAAELAHVRLRGLMCIPPPAAGPGKNLPYFEKLAQIAVDIRNEMGDNRADVVCLSMGMSDDYQDAVSAGATHVRLGTALFGPRPPVPINFGREF